MCSCVAAGAAETDEDAFSSWIARHNKSYSSGSEREMRFQYFRKRLAVISAHRNPNYRVGLNWDQLDLSDAVEMPAAAAAAVRVHIPT